MSKLYTGKEVATPEVSVEGFNHYYNTAEVVSLESFNDYIYKIADIFRTNTSAILGFDNDKIVTDTLSNRFETINVAKRLNFAEVRDIVISKPENFEGKYIFYIKDLLSACDNAMPHIEDTLYRLKMAISAFMNDEKDDITYGTHYFTKAEAYTLVQQKRISAYFPKANNGVKGRIGDVLKSLNDIPELYTSVVTLDKTMNLEDIKKISTTVSQATELVDLLIDQNMKTGIMLRNDATKKSLINSIHIAAREVEYVAYLYSNCIYLYSAIKSLSEGLINAPTK